MKPIGPSSRLESRRPRHQSDLGNAERLVDLRGRDLRYVHSAGNWLVWDGTRWAADTTGEVERRAAATVRTIYREAERADNVDEREELAKHAIRSESRARIDGMIALARSRHPIPIEAGALDANPWLLNVANGTIDLRRGTRQPHRREDLITKLAPVAYVPEATAPLWNGFLEEVIPDPETRAFLQRAAGYSLTGSTREQVILILFGSGQNGKTTFLEATHAVLGDYAIQADVELLLDRRNHGIPNDVARLRGARFVGAVESGEGRRLDETLVKRLTGGDTVTARFLHQEFFEFRMVGKLWLATNHRPTIRGTDDAIWRRIRLVPFTIKVPDSEVDRELGEKLAAEASGILNWFIEGCLEWQRIGLGSPGAITAATAEYRSAEDLTGAFLAECCVTGSEYQVSSGDLFRAYRAWCDASGERPLNQSDFGSRLTGHGFERRQYGHARRWHWFGLGILSPGSGGGSDANRRTPADPDSDLVAAMPILNEVTPQSGLAGFAGSAAETTSQVSQDDGRGVEADYPSSAWDVGLAPDGKAP